MEKTLQPKLRFKEFSGEWEKKRLRDVTTLIKDGTHDTHQNDESGDCYLLSAKNITTGKLEITNADRRISNSEYNKIYKNYSLEKNDLLLSVVGSIGYSAIYKTEKKVAFQRSVAFIRLNKENFSNYYHQLLLSNVFKKEMWKRIIHVAFPQKLTLQELGKCKIKNPPLPEQEKIASFLSSVDSKIEKLEKKRELLSQYKKGIMQKIFSQEIRFKDDNGGEYPQWEEKKLGEVTTFKQGYQIPFSQQIREPKEGYLRYLYISDFFSDTKVLYVKKEAKMTALEKGDIVVANTGNTAGSFYRSKNGILSNNMFSITKTKTINNEFMYVFLCSELYSKQLKQFFNSGGQPHLGHKNMSMIRIKYPCLEEQEKVANFLSSIDKKIELVEREVEKNKAFKKGLLQQMFV